MSWKLLRRLRYGCVLLPLVGFGCVALSGCKEEPPPPTQTKEERRLQEKEMMQREMRNE